MKRPAIETVEDHLARLEKRISEENVSTLFPNIWMTVGGYSTSGELER
jgi:hypothetical protein